MFDYPSLSALAAVVREGSFEKAARALHVTPSAVSQRVKLLEERVGSALVIRGQPARATEVGHHLCRHAEQVGLLELDLHHRLPASARLQAGKPGGASRPSLRIAVNADSLATWFMAAMAHFVRDTGDGVMLDIVVDDQDHTAEWLRRGEVLAAVTAHARPVQGCRAVRIGSIAYAATASPEYMARHFASGVHAQSLREAPSLRFSHKDALQERWVRSVCRRSLDMPMHWLPSTRAFVDASLAGVGWGMNPLALVDQHLRAGRLVELVPGHRLDTPLVWQHQRLAVPLLERLGDCVVAAARSPGPVAAA
jgi:LysR family transcriptional regulator, chromosome initiation inhibitor